MFIYAVLCAGESLIRLTVILALAVLSFGTAVHYVYYVEPDADEERYDLCGAACYRSIGSACWSVTNTIFTSGYVDSVPVTIAGRCLTGLASFVGVLALALSIEVFESNFSRLHAAHTLMSNMLRELMCHVPGRIDAPKIERWLSVQLSSSRLTRPKPELCRSFLDVANGAARADTSQPTTCGVPGAAAGAAGHEPPAAAEPDGLEMLPRGSATWDDYDDDDAELQRRKVELLSMEDNRYIGKNQRLGSTRNYSEDSGGLDGSDDGGVSGGGGGGGGGGSGDTSSSADKVNALSPAGEPLPPRLASGFRSSTNASMSTAMGYRRNLLVRMGTQELEDSKTRWSSPCAGAGHAGRLSGSHRARRCPTR